MGSDSAFGEKFYKDVPYNEDGKIDLPLGTKVRLKGKHCVVAGGGDCHGCILQDDGMITGLCFKIACTFGERADERNIKFEEIIHE